ncbi:uncharacterized protein Z519_04803 [Cladophialophora bantiana CBS 173.52]|uniref:Uncharacterized protein n=1 Tax=Cladophialophora bantiana (strain ATCC 10958 / CBS 173.52 / CDC B-1940 / NIH 8579) TaxID=1442370 RepID=A0A0D2HVC8_CLAB1|nr:uncharacterized protein Z519_04803 [Cladophialophora bantiana CBS 173.52]KIW94825.1 hypothetical protein Z519_04803 [Cladophialophora bantiana CBS 173.52]
MASESHAPESSDVKALCGQLQEDSHRDHTHGIEGKAMLPQHTSSSTHTDVDDLEDRTTSAEATPEALFKDGHDPGHDHISRLPALLGREGSGVVSSDEVQFEFAPIQPSHLNHQHMEPSSFVDRRVFNCSDSMPSPKIDTLTRASSIAHMADSVGVGPMHESRVSKTPRKHRPKPTQHRQMHRPRTTGTLPQPSEEDLLFLLMSRARETQKSLERLVFLEHENQSLRRLQGQTDAELRQMANARDECAQYSELLRDSLDVFREKYYKLKKWAMETNKDCEMLQQKAAEFQQTLTALAKDRDQLFMQLQEVRCSSRVTSERTERVREGVREAKSMAQNSVTTIKQLDAFAIAQDEHLRSEKQRCRKLEAHILHLEQEKNKQNVKLHHQHQITNKALQDLSKQLGTLQNEKSEANTAAEHINECLHRIMSMIEDDLEDLIRSKEDYTSVNASLTKLEGSLSEKVQTAIASLKHDLQHDVSTQASRLLSEVQSGNIELVEAKAEVARLEGKTEQTQEIIELLRDAKCEAQRHETELRDVNKSLRNNKEAAQIQSEELRTSLRTVTTKWQIACSELEKCRQDKIERQAEVTDLTIRLTEAMQEHSSLQAELTTIEDILSESERQNEQQNTELNHMSARLSNLQTDLDHEIQRALAIEDEVASIKAQESQTRHDLDKSRAETATAIEHHQELQEQIGMLEQKLSQADDDSRKLEETLNSLREATAELEDLRQLRCSLQALKQESVSQLQQIAEDSTEIQTLQRQIENLRNRSAHLDEQARERDRLAEENTIIHTELKDLRGRLSEQEDLQEKLQQKITENAVLESTLTAAQGQTARISGLETTNTSLEEAVTSLTENLKQLNEQCAQIAPLQETAKEKDNQITELQKQLSSLGGQTDELKNLRGELRQKEEQLTLMQQRILSLEGAVSNAKLDDYEATRPQQQPRGADRSGNAKSFHYNELHHSRPSSSGGDAQLLNDGSPLHSSSSNALTGVMSVVPETQIEVQETLPVERESLLLSPEQGQVDYSSALAPVSTPDGEANLENVIHQDLGHSTRRYDRNRVHVWPSKGTASNSRAGESGEQALPSSNESQSDQMLLDQVSQGDLKVPNNFDTTDIGLNFTISSSGITSKQGPSPRRLRSELRVRNYHTASPDSSGESQGHRPSTPAIMRERYQPNSAAKRRMDPDNVEDKASPENSKRLKRRPANLEARKPPPITPKQRVEKSSSRATVGFRKDSTAGGTNSVVGTNAPGPGKSQRTSKPARRGSRQDKYATRFAAGT